MKNLNNMNNKKKQYKYVTTHQWYRYRYADLDFNSLEEDVILSGSVQIGDTVMHMDVLFKIYMLLTLISIDNYGRFRKYSI